MLKRACLLVSFVFLAGCSTTLRVPESQPEMTKTPEQAWADILKTHVNDRGEVDFEALKRDPRDLNHWVSHIAKFDPSTLKTKEEKLAYHINAYNGLSMYTVIQRGIPKTNAGLNKVGFFYFTKMKIAGQEMSLYTYENEIIRKMGEERIHFALNCSALGCPILPKKPFTAANLEKELEAESFKFFSEERNFRIDHKERKVYLSEILDFFTEDFLVRKPNLVAYANIYAKEKAPEDYKVKFTDYDWTIANWRRR